MKNLKYIALATIISAGAFTATTFADDSNDSSDAVNQINKPIMSNYKMYGTGMIYNGSGMNNTGSGMKDVKGNGQVMIDKYLRTDLTDDEKTALEVIKKNHNEAMKYAMETMKPENNSGATQEDMKTKIETLKAKIKVLHEEFIAALIPYIDTAKVEEFKLVMTKMSMMTNGLMNGQKNGVDNGNQKGKNKEDDKTNNTNKKNQQVKVTLPDSVVKTLDKKIATFTTVDEKTTWLKGIVTKIDTLLKKALSEKSKNLLNALKNLVNERIEVLSGDGLDADALIDILQ